MCTRTLSSFQLTLPNLEPIIGCKLSPLTPYTNATTFAFVRFSGELSSPPPATSRTPILENSSKRKIEGQLQLDLVSHAPWSLARSPRLMQDENYTSKEDWKLAMFALHTRFGCNWNDGWITYICCSTTTTAVATTAVVSNSTSECNHENNKKISHINTQLVHI